MRLELIEPLHRRVLSCNSMQFLLRSELQLQHRARKPPAISARFCSRNIPGVSNLFETCNVIATKLLHLVARQKSPVRNGA